MKRIQIAIIILISMLYVTCDLALGTLINMKGPVVRIAGPQKRTEEAANIVVSTIFNLNGTTQSPTQITRMTVTLDYATSSGMVRMGREWKWEGNWETRESASSAWRAYSYSDYNDFIRDDPIDPPTWSIQGETVYWNLPILLDRMEKGDYFITVSAWDSAGLHDSNSMLKYKVNYNNTAPNLRIRIPDSTRLLADKDGSSLSYPEPPDLNDRQFTFDPFGQPDLTYRNRNRFFNSFPQLAYDIEVSGVGYENLIYFLDITITNQHNLDGDFSDRVTYWEWNSETTGAYNSTNNKLPQRGIFQTAGTQNSTVQAGFEYKKTGNAVALNSLADALPRDKITPIQLVSTVTDDIGNKEYKSKGWFLYLPDSDKPFIDLGFGQKVKAGALVPANAPDTNILPRNTIYSNNQIYDDDGIKSLDWKLYKLEDTGSNPLPQVVDSTYFAGTDNILNSPLNTTWTFTTDGKFGLGRFKLVVVVKDINNIDGEEYHTYFTIESNATPTVKEWTTSANTTLWGDVNGNIKIQGVAQVEDSEAAGSNDVKVEEVRILWLRPGVSTEVMINYQDSAYSEWQRATPAGYTDLWGNKLWLVTNTAPNSSTDGIWWDPTTDGNKNKKDSSPGSAFNYQEDYHFTKTLSLFTDLGIGKTGLAFSTQSFIAHVSNYNSDRTRMRSTTSSISTLGDTTPPIVKIGKIWVDDGTGYKDFTQGQPLPTLPKDAEVYIEGTWSDDSMGAWTDITTRHNTHMQNLVVSWEGELGRINFPIDTFTASSGVANDGTWKTAVHKYDEQNMDPSVMLTASIQDLARNTGREDWSVLINTDNPTLIRITSDAPDGSYSTSGENGDGYIYIYMEFNKPVTFGSVSAPTITLNVRNGAILSKQASLTPNNQAATSNGTSNVEFRYPVATGDTTDGQLLNVTAINWNGAIAYPPASSIWRGVGQDSTARVSFPTNENDIYITSDSTKSYALARQKKIIIDTASPTITSVAASSQGRFGKDSVITINVTFNERVEILGESGFTLSLGNVTTAVATFQNRTGPNSLSFEYVVGPNDNSGTGGNSSLTVSGINLAGGTIKDVAGNNLNVTGFPRTLSNVFVDTTAYSAPTINNVASGLTYYGDTSFYVSALESNEVTVEYSLNGGTSWNTYTGNITGNSTGDISFPSNGTYNIWVRQIDTAKTTPNVSANATANNVKIDKGAILQRISSTKPDGIYAHEAGDVIDITMHFRIPVFISGTTTTTFVTLNTLDASTSANYQGISADGKTMTFRYTIPEYAHTNGEKLNVSAISWGNASVWDKAGGTGTNLETVYIRNQDILALNTDNRLNGQRDIKIQTGRPIVANRQLGNGIVFTDSRLTFNFDRDIIRGSTSKKLIIMQIAEDYQIPAVMSEKRFTDIFKSRNDIFTNDFDDVVTPTVKTRVANASAWEALGNIMYERSSNGAAISGTTATSDTTVKRVLIYNINPSSADTTVISGAITMADVKALFRAAEALTFNANDNANLVDIESVGGNPRALVLKLTGERELPVKGARYQWAVPNGFVRDTLGIENGGSDLTVNDGQLTATATTNNTLLLPYTGVELPAIRIRKTDETLGTGANRNAAQPLQSQVTINCRTPGVTLSYRTRSNADTVGPILMRNNPGYGTNNLPWLGHTQTTTAISGTNYTTYATYANFEASKMVPQSTHLNLRSTMGNWPNTYTNYTAFSIGTTNYNEGGLEVHIDARAVKGSDIVNAYEAAYRSVFVFNNQNLNGNGGRLDVGNGLNRVWLRGGDSTDGDPTVPDFPIARDKGKWKKARLLTAVDATFTAPNYNDTLSPRASTNEIGTGQFLWFWATWKINVPAYVDLHFASLPSDDSSATLQAPTGNIRYLFHAYIPSKEHYAVFPGRTTIVETRAVYNYVWTGQIGEVALTDASSPETRTD